MSSGSEISQVFSMRAHVKDATEDIHTALHRHPFSAALMRRTIDPQVFRNHLFQQSVYVGALEQALQSKVEVFKQDSSMSQLYQFFHGLFLADAAKDACDALDASKGTREEKLDFKDVNAYSKAVLSIEDEDARFLFVHAWALLCQQMFGGTILKQKVSQLFGSDVAKAYPYKGSMKDAKKEMAEVFEPNFNAIFSEKDQEACAYHALEAFKVVHAAYNVLHGDQT